MLSDSQWLAEPVLSIQDLFKKIDPALIEDPLVVPQGIQSPLFGKSNGLRRVSKSLANPVDQALEIGIPRCGTIDSDPFARNVRYFLSL